jgi:predicted O-methyltransferase YrrM
MGVTPDRATQIQASLREWRRATPGLRAIRARQRVKQLQAADPYCLCTPEELVCLAALAEGSIYALEVGRFAGATTALLALCCARVVSLDSDLTRAVLRRIAPYHVSHLDERRPGWQHLSDVAGDLLRRLDVSDRCELVCGDTRDAATWPDDRDFGIAFVDGGHDAETCYSDMNNAWWRLGRGGVLAVHDYDLALRSDPDSGVDLAWDWWLARCEREGTAYAGPYATAGSSIVWVRKETGS